MNRIFDTRPLNADLGALLLRLTVGGLFIYYGYGKLANYDQMVTMFGDVIGIGTKLSLNLVIFAELFCGIFVTVGLLTRLSIIPIFITMTVAYFVAHAADPFQAKVPAFTFWCLCFVVFVLGSGRYSVDNLIFNRNKN
jgi:putative oxidoreductase